MPGELQPLSQNFAIVKADGTPTEYFIRWAQQRQIDIQGGITAEQAQQLIDDWAAARAIIAGFGLDGGGTLNADVTIDLNASIGQLNDVDLSTPATDNQVLAYDEAAGLWKPVDQSGGGGGGGSRGLYDISKGVPPLASLQQVGPVGSYAWTENPGVALNVKQIGNPGGIHLVGFNKTLAGAAFDYAVLALPTFDGRNYYGPSIGLYNSANGRYQALTFATSNGYSGYSFANWNNDSSRAALTEPSYGPSTKSNIWMHVKSDGTTLSYGWSDDGANPMWLFTAPATGDWLGDPPTHVFFGAFNELSNAQQNGNVTILCVDDAASTRKPGDSSGGGGGGGGGWTVIQEQDFDGTTSSIMFASIPATYSDLRLFWTGKIDSGPEAISRLQINGSTGKIYHRRMYSSGGVGADNQNAADYINAVSSQTGAGAPSFHDFTFPRYAAGMLQRFFEYQAFQQNDGLGGTAYTITGSGFHNDTAPISSIEMTNSAGANFSAGGYVALYGR